MFEPTQADAQPRPARRLDRKLGRIAEGRYTPADFVLADAKDADMAFGVTAVGSLTEAPVASVGPGLYRTRDSYLESMRSMAGGGVFDILLTSASNGERLVAEGWPDEEVTLAVRGNDSTDIWLSRGSDYRAAASRPFRTVDLAAIRPFCDLVLYSVTLNNNVERDLATLEAYRDFRIEAAALGIRHFLEVFNPNVPVDLKPDEVAAFVNDSVIRVLAGITSAQRPVFLKLTYNGAGALAELVEHDPSLVVGILGGTAGTTRDTFELLHRIEANGGRVALFGRKIQGAESQPDLVGLMPLVLRGELDPAGAVRAYHARLTEIGTTPRRALEADLELTDATLLAE